VERYCSQDSSILKQEELAFFHKLVGDYYRYGCEANSSSKQTQEVLRSMKKGA